MLRGLRLRPCVCPSARSGQHFIDGQDARGCGGLTAGPGVPDSPRKVRRCGASASGAGKAVLGSTLRNYRVVRGRESSAVAEVPWVAPRDRNFRGSVEPAAAAVPVMRCGGSVGRPSGPEVPQQPANGAGSGAGGRPAEVPVASRDPNFRGSVGRAVAAVRLCGCGGSGRPRRPTRFCSNPRRMRFGRGRPCCGGSGR